jgi:hypothetical protein
MSKMLFLAAMAVMSLACHSRSEDEVGAAPDQRDTTAVTVDSARTDSDNATVTVDSIGTDSALTNQEAPGTPGTTDTMSTVSPDPAAVADSSMVHGDSAIVHDDSAMVHGDSAMTGHTIPDTTSGR